jgi:UDP-N-acetylmuramyl pentapeptide synthase
MALRQLESVNEALGWFAERGVRSLTTDSRKAGEGDAFIAWPGYAVDARQFVPQAISAGASACLVEAEGSAKFEPYGEEAKERWAWASRRLPDDPIRSPSPV